MRAAVLFMLAISSLAASARVPVTSVVPAPVGRLIDVGGQRVHLHCSGRGAPTVVIETGLGDFSFDWILVRRRVEARSRICTYDRAGRRRWWIEPLPG